MSRLEASSGSQNRGTEMSTEKRRAGRAIRKQRREQREVLAAVAKINLAALGQAMVDAFTSMWEAVVDAFVFVGTQMLAFAEAYSESRQQEYRMTYRALTTGAVS